MQPLAKTSSKIVWRSVKNIGKNLPKIFWYLWQGLFAEICSGINIRQIVLKIDFLSFLHITDKVIAAICQDKLVGLLKRMPRLAEALEA